MLPVGLDCEAGVVVSSLLASKGGNEEGVDECSWTAAAKWSCEGMLAHSVEIAGTRLASQDSVEKDLAWLLATLQNS
jgi:hypothetical protein